MTLALAILDAATYPSGLIVAAMIVNRLVRFANAST